MKRQTFKSMVLVIMLVTALALASTTSADGGINFDSYATGTAAEDLAIPGIDFDGAGSYTVRKVDYASHAMSGMSLGNWGCGSASLRLTFSQPQGSISFGWVSDMPTLNVIASLGGAQVQSQSFTGAVQVGDFEGTASVNEKFDSLLIFSPSNCMGIDNLVIRAASDSDTSDSQTSIIRSSHPGCVNSDGRANGVCESPAQEAAVYCTAEGGIHVYGIDDSGNGYLAFAVSADEIRAVGIPEENTLVASTPNGHIRLYILAGKSAFQVNAARHDLINGFDINGYVFTWQGCGS